MASSSVISWKSQIALLPPELSGLISSYLLPRRIEQVFERSFQGNSHQDILPSKTFNYRGDLRECGCERLNRVTRPSLRLQFENEVIGTGRLHEKFIDK